MISPLSSRQGTDQFPGVFLFAFFGIPGGKEGDITGHDRENK
nr:MAG TPA: hypothetical protein [Caudoviricetes sp.]